MSFKSRSQTKPRTKAKNGLKQALCLDRRENTSDALNGIRSLSPLLNFPNGFSQFCGHKLFGDCVESCTRVTERQGIVSESKIALASISRYLPTKVKTTSLEKERISAFELSA